MRNIFSSSRPLGLFVILGQLTRCEKSFVPAKKFVVEREREEIET